MEHNTKTDILGTLSFLLLIFNSLVRADLAEAEIIIGPEHSFEFGYGCDVRVNRTTGHPHVVYMNGSGKIKYTYYTGSNWSQAIQVPGATSDSFDPECLAMEMDSAGRIHIVYATNSFHQLYYVHQDGQGWSTPSLIHDGGSNDLIFADMARTSQDEIYLTFNEGGTPYCRKFNGSSWGPPERLLNLYSNVRDVSVDSQDKPHIALRGKINNEYYETFYVTTNQSGNWQSTQITQMPETPWVDDPVCAVDPWDRVHIIWTVLFSETQKELRYAQYDGATTPGTYVTTANEHTRSRLVCDDGGALYAFVSRRYPPKLMVREKEGEPWTGPFPLGTDDDGYWLLRADAYGCDVHVVYGNPSGACPIKNITYRKITRPDCQIFDSVSVDLGTVDDEQGLSRVVVGDGDTEPVMQGGRDCRKNVNPNQDFYFYFDVREAFAYQGDNPDLCITIDYYDTGSGSLTLQYDAVAGGAYKTGGSVTLAGTDTWRQHIYHVTDAYFGNRQNGGADFRIFGGAGNTFYLDVVEVSEPPEIELDITSIDHSVAIGNKLPNDGFTIRNIGGGTLNYTINDNAIWLSVSPEGGASTGEIDPIEIIYQTAGLEAGDYSAVVSVEDPNATNSPQEVAVDVHVYIPGDFDDDGDVDSEDFGLFQACYSGSGFGYQAGCEAADLDPDGAPDGDVDLDDFAVFQECMGGANKPPGC